MRYLVEFESMFVFFVSGTSPKDEVEDEDEVFFVNGTSQCRNLRNHMLTMPLIPRVAVCCSSVGVAQRDGGQGCAARTIPCF